MALRAMSHLPHGGILARSVASEDRAPAPAATKFGWANPPDAFPDRPSFHQSSRSSTPAILRHPPSTLNELPGPPLTARWPRRWSPCPRHRGASRGQRSPGSAPDAWSLLRHSIPVARRSCAPPRALVSSDPGMTEVGALPRVRQSRSRGRSSGPPRRSGCPLRPRRWAWGTSIRCRAAGRRFPLADRHPHRLAGDSPADTGLGIGKNQPDRIAHLEVDPVTVPRA
jgi:hypothetical protein